MAAHESPRITKLYRRYGLHANSSSSGSVGKLTDTLLAFAEDS
jgi:hypothetical protein